MLRQLDTSVWVIDHELSAGGLILGTRTTVLRMADGAVLVCSPGPLDAADRAAIAALGPVRALVAPNLLHHLYLGAAIEAFAGAHVLAPDKLRAKRSDLRIDEDVIIGLAAWQGELATVPILGMPRVDEVVLVHLPSRTLIVTDLVFNIRHSKSWLTRTLMRLNGGYGSFGPTRLCRFLIKDRAAARTSLEAVLALDFDRVIVTHGEVLDSGGQEAMRRGFAWLLGPGAS